MPLIPFDTFEKSCSEFAIVFTMSFPILIFIGLLVTVLVKKFAYKQTWDDIKFYVYYMIAFFILITSAVFLYSKVPGIFCGFFMVYFVFLLVQPFISTSTNKCLIA